MTILKETSSEVVIKKSKFISYIFHVESKKEVNDILSKIKEEHKDARHVVYSFLLSNGYKGASENKEPIKSAHKVLNILENKGLYDIICIAVRYFGGIELGASNLERTYVSCIVDLIAISDIYDVVDYHVYYGLIKTNMFDIFCKKLLEAKGQIESKEFLGPEVKIKFCVDKMDESFSKYLVFFKDVNLIEKKYVKIS